MSLYDAPALYDRLYADGTESEARLLVELHRRHGNGGTRWLEPACGTGRYLKALEGLGQEAEGYDRSPKMLAFARGRGAKAVRGELTRFVRPRAFDAAFCLHNTFRHLLSEREAVAHLRRVAASLRPGGIYILGLDLTGYDGEDDEESFDGMVVISLAPDRKRRRERVLTFYEERGKMKQDEYELRSYGREELERTLRASPFRLAAVHDLYGKPATLDDSTRAAYFVLKVG